MPDALAQTGSAGCLPSRPSFVNSNTDQTMTDIVLPPETLKDWEAFGQPPATEDELAALAGLAGTPLPEDYIAFISAHGFAQWDMDLPSWFTYRLEEAGGVVDRSACLTHLRGVKRIEQGLKFGFADDPANGLPIAPPHIFPFAGTGGSDVILLDKVDGGIWFWPEDRQGPWGSGDNTELGFIAANFTDFINTLKPEAKV